jgi:hypothetical protein
VFGIDYDLTLAGVAQPITNVCTDWVNGMVDGIQKKATLAGDFRVVCP